MTAPEALRSFASELDAKAEEARSDWVGVLLKSNVRSRIEAFTEAATLCRAAAKRFEGKYPGSAGVAKGKP